MELVLKVNLVMSKILEWKLASPQVGAVILLGVSCIVCSRLNTAIEN